MPDSLVHRTLTSLLIAVASASALHARELSLEQRIRAQEALERVSYSHHVGASKPFSNAVPHAVLVAKVRKHLRQSVALDKYWYSPVTAEALERELERMTGQTRMPERLRELFAALDDDPFLIQETLVRAALVERLTHNFFAYDQRIHAAALSEAKALREALVDGRLDPYSTHQQRVVVHLVRSGAGSDAGAPAAASRPRLAGQPRVLQVSPAEFDRWKAKVPLQVGEIGPVTEELERFLIRVALDRGEADLRLALYSVAKRDWADWWSEVEAGFDPEALAPVAADISLPEPPSLDANCLPDDSWEVEPYAPRARTGHVVVWTGSRMIVWGGMVPDFANQPGALYDPATDSWTPTSTIGAPSDRTGHSAVWTGNRMLVWGGGPPGSGSSNGASYDPLADSWAPITTKSAPAARYGHTAIWTGSRMVVWGGRSPASLQSGGVYDPQTDTWTPTSTTAAPSARSNHTAVWAANRMVVWGGTSDSTGGRYDPATDTWAPTSTIGAPSARSSHTAVSIGDRMLVWGGFGGLNLSTGGRYDPALDTWAPTATLAAPSARQQHAALSTGNRMLVWGGVTGASSTHTGARYDPSTDTWEPLPTTNAPSARASHTAVWTGARMIVWGGGGSTSYFTPFATGGSYDPATKSWTPTHANYDSGAPVAYGGQSVVWTGSLMIVWGGYDQHAFSSGRGARYDPATHSWAPTWAGLSPRDHHTAVWSGERMIVWGGEDEQVCECLFNNGSRYDPISDSWQPMSNTSAPADTVYHTAVWTGNQMIVWGGYGGSTGGRYNPQANSWSPVSLVGAPAESVGHTAVWAGDRMIVWGGTTTSANGARYDPVANSWAPVATAGAPSPRFDHSAISTGSRMIVWGGYDGLALVNTGGSYDPVTNGWVATSTDVPAGASHTAVWTGDRMIVWGGVDNTGSVYDASRDSWAPMTTIDAPVALWEHDAVWTGSSMLVYGGQILGVDPLEDAGGSYALGHGEDGDGDGLSECLGDCNDANEATYAGAIEVNDGLDNQCPGEPGYGVIDDISGLVFDDAVDPTIFCWDAQPWATSYQIARTVDPTFLTTCSLSVTASTCASDAALPAAGVAFHYLVRAFAPHAGGWGHSLGAAVCP